MSRTTTRTALTHDETSLDHITASQLRTWAAVHPCLTSTSATDLVALIQGRTDDGTLTGNDEALWCMLDLASTDPEAARIVLHAMRPLIESSARRSRASYLSADDALAAAVSEMWETIRRFPLHRRRATLGNLRGDFLKRLCGRWAHTETEEALSCDPDEIDALPSPAGPNSQGEVLELLALGVDAGAITPDEASLLLTLCVDETPADEAASAMGISHAALRQRKCRALRRLSTWARNTI